MLESRLFQLENRNDSDIENSLIENNAKAAEKSVGLSVPEITSHPLKAIKLDLGKNVYFNFSFSHKLRHSSLSIHNIYFSLHS